mgnify:CR=1 FL=1
MSRQLPCGHEFCKSCLAQLKEKGVAQTCPLCRKRLPPGLDKLYDLGYRMYWKVKGEIDRSRPKGEEYKPWPALSAEQQRVMDQAVAMMREAAAQGHVWAQFECGTLYQCGHGVAVDPRLAFMYFDKAAKQGHSPAQNMAAFCYELGLGVTQNYQEARRLYALSSAQGFPHATERLNELEEKIRAECPLLGKRVVITGTSREDLNGRVGVAQNFDASKGRYVVQLEDEEGEPLDMPPVRYHLLRPGGIELSRGERAAWARRPHTSSARCPPTCCACCPRSSTSRCCSPE